MPQRRSITAWVEALWEALDPRQPAPSTAYEIAQRMGCDVVQVYTLLHFVRTQPPARFGWTIPHVQRGSIAPRRAYLRVTYAELARGSARVNSAPVYAAIQVGLAGTVQGIATTAGSGAGGLLSAVAHLADPFQQRQARRLARQLQAVEAEAQDLAEDIRQRLNGTA